MWSCTGAMLISTTMAKNGSLALLLSQKVYDLIHDLLQERTEQSKKENDEIPPDLLLHIALARDLQTPQVIAYAQSKDMLLRRQKLAILETHVNSMLKVCREDELMELAEVIRVQDEASANEAAEDGDNLMDAVDTNSMNRLVVALWGEKKDETAPTEDKDIDDTDNDKDGERGKKRGGREVTKKAKKPKYDATPPELTLAALGGLLTVTTQLMELVGLPILHPEIYQATGVEPPRGVLLYGPPGCGKTTIAHALAGELKVPFINISAPSVVLGMSGESEKKLREIFEQARLVAPCLIFLDEIDAITPKRDGGAQREMERRIVAQLLTLMDELTLENTDGKPVIVLGATNRPDALDSALRRAGRFDREICLNVPNEEQRSSILKAMTRRLRLEDERFDFRELAKLTPGYVGADLRSLVTAAGIAAINRIFEGMADDEASLVADSLPVVLGPESSVESTSLILPVDALTVSGTTPMELDVATQPKSSVSPLQLFLARHPDPLTPEQLAPLRITYADFLQALPTIQPTAKREGFATVPDVSWQNVGALSKIRMELHMCIVQPIRKPELYSKVGISAPAGVLMWGPPGCGKTLLAKAVANESRANFISVKGPELLNKYVGESERAVRQVFQRARALAPCIIFFDELDALVPRRTLSLSELSARVVNTLLTELDGLNDRQGIFVVGATNRPDMIDPAMLRPGRLDKTLYIELPTPSERLEILRTLTRANRTPLAPNVDLEAISNAEKCRNFSGADLSLLVREAGVCALKKKFFHGQNIADLDRSGWYEDVGDMLIAVTQEDFARALDSISPSVSDADRERYDRLSKRTGLGAE